MALDPDFDPRQGQDAWLWPSPGVSIRGVVEGDLARAGLVVEARDARGLGGTAVVGEDGRFEIRDLPSGPRYTVRVATPLPAGVRASEAAGVSVPPRT